MTAAAAPSVSSHESTLGSWERAWHRPSEPLRGLIAGYTGYRQHMSAPATHRGIPAPRLPLVINFGPAQTIVLPHSGKSPARVSSFLAGLHDRYVMIDADSHHGIQVELDPLAASRLLGRPLRELTSEVVPLDALFGREADRLVDALATEAGWPGRFRLLDRYLRHRLATACEPPAELAWVARRILATRGRVRVADLAEEVRFSPRHLRGRFGAQFGLSPKRLARLARFDHAAGLLAAPHGAGGGAGLAEIATLAGYYDQAHFTNEVTEFSGLSPAKLRAQHLPDAGGVFEFDPA